LGPDRVRELIDQRHSREAAKLLGISTQRVRKLRQEGKFPQPIRRVGRTDIYERRAVEPAKRAKKKQP